MVCTPHFIANAQEESLAQPTILTCILCRGFCTLVLFISSAVKRVTVSDIIHNLIEFYYQDRHSGV